MIHIHDDIYITADRLQFILVKKTIVEKGKLKGQEAFTNIKYFPSFDMLLKSIFNSMLYKELETEKIESFEMFAKRYKKLTVFLKNTSDKIGNTKNLYRILESDKVETL